MFSKSLLIKFIYLIVNNMLKTSFFIVLFSLSNNIVIKVEKQEIF